MNLAGFLGALFGLALLAPLYAVSIWLYLTLDAPVWVWVSWAVGAGGTTMLALLNAVAKAVE